METEGFSLFESGDLEGAIAATIALVKDDPMDVKNRFFLAELFCFSGQWERADKQLDTVAKQEEQATQRSNLLRQLIRAEIAREQFFTDGRVPELSTDPSEVIGHCLRSSIAIREKDYDTAASLLSLVEMKRAKISGTMGETAFSDLRDLDDLTSSFFEVLTSNGKYYWVPMENIVSIEFSPPETVKDLLWRNVNLSVSDGLNGEVYLPVRYSETRNSEVESLKLGRETDWTDPEKGFVCGIGQREFLVGEDVVPIMELNRIEFTVDSN